MKIIASVDSLGVLVFVGRAVAMFQRQMEDETWRASRQVKDMVVAFEPLGGGPEKIAFYVRQNKASITLRQLNPDGSAA